MPHAPYLLHELLRYFNFIGLVTYHWLLLCIPARQLARTPGNTVSVDYQQPLQGLSFAGNNKARLSRQTEASITTSVTEDTRNDHKLQSTLYVACIRRRQRSAAAA